MHSAVRSARSSSLVRRRTPARRRTRSARGGDRRLHRPRSGPSPNTAPRRSGTAARAAATAAGTAGARFSRMWRPANTTSRLRVVGHGRRQVAGVLALEDLRRPPRTPSASSRSRCRRLKQNARCGIRRHASWTTIAHEAAGAAEVLVPVAARPHLVPVDDEPEAVPPPRDPGGEQREVGERRGVDDVVAAAVAQQVREHPAAEAQRRGDPAVAVGAVELVAAATRRSPARPRSPAARTAPTAAA